jgi:hypothetical protein
MTVKNEFEGIWKEAVIVNLRYHPEIYLKRPMKNLSQDNEYSQYPG